MFQIIRRKFSAEMINEMRAGINTFFEVNRWPIRVQSLAVRHINNTLRVYLSVSDFCFYEMLEQDVYRFINDCLHYDRDKLVLKVTAEDESIVAKKPDVDQWKKGLDELRSVSVRPDEVNESDLNLLNMFISRAAEQSQADDGLKKHITNIIKRIFWSDKAQERFSFLLDGFDQRDSFEQYELVCHHLSCREHLLYFSEEILEIEKECLDVDEQDDFRQFYIRAINKLENGIKSFSELEESLCLYLAGLESAQNLGRFLSKFSKYLLQHPLQLKWLVEDDFRLDLILNKEKLRSFAKNKQTFDLRKAAASQLLIEVHKKQALFQQKLQNIRESYTALVSPDRASRREAFFSSSMIEKYADLEQIIVRLKEKVESQVWVEYFTDSPSEDKALLAGSVAVADDDLVETPQSPINPNQLFSPPSQSPECVSELEKFKQPEPEPEPELKLENISLEEKQKAKSKARPKVRPKEKTKSAAKDIDKEKKSHIEREGEMNTPSWTLMYQLKDKKVSPKIHCYKEKSTSLEDGHACYPLSEFVFVLVLPGILDLERSVHNLLENNVGRGLLSTVGLGRPGVKSFKDFAIIKTRDETRIVCARRELLDNHGVIRTVFIPVKAIDSHETYIRKVREDKLAEEANTSLNSSLSELHLIEPVLKTARVCRS